MKAMGCARVIVASVIFSLASSTASAQAHELVDVGGYRLDVVRAGQGSPVVVFEAGLGDSLDDWASIWPEVAKLTTVVAYSRAGLGRSDPPTNPSDRSAHREATELHSLLARLGVRPPYVLVPRSYGSILARLYTSLWPNEVAGLAIVEGTHEQQVKRWGLIDSTYPGAFRVYFDSVLGTLPPNGAEAGETRETVRIQTAGAVEGLTPLPDIPIAVLTSMKSDPRAQYVNGTPRGHAVWRELHEEWFRRSRNGIHIETSHSGHALQNDEPQLVIEAIRFVLERVRTP
jgi:pimeloyl-ACP methyl ester carboxylesterase